MAKKFHANIDIIQQNNIHILKQLLFKVIESIKNLQQTVATLEKIVEPIKLLFALAIYMTDHHQETLNDKEVTPITGNIVEDNQGG
ncbi:MULTISPECIES: hypothetical protein [unclassified Rickettsia]|uniref:hypothetical protein n=1 Tax=unclassified Rickettsia TaxID=114295 RepID=UPI0020A1E8D9|nr:hypothetical protein [Rickettsia endosymbiont of Ceutorhynchus assimilis]